MGFSRRRSQETLSTTDGGLAAQLEYSDVQIGRVIKTLERIDELDNTLIFVTSDNEASGEGGLAGPFHETCVLNGMPTPFDTNMRHLDHWGKRTPVRTITRAGR